MFVTFEVPQLDISGLQLVLPSKRPFMLVTHWVFQAAMGP